MDVAASGGGRNCQHAVDSGPELPMQGRKRDTELAETIASDAASRGPAAVELCPGDRVGQFEVRRRIGSGGMGDVYLARDLTLGRRVALKVVRSDQRLSEAALDRFLIEAQATARFNHPNIVGIYGAGEHAGAPYVALEYVRGQTLRERLQERPPGLPEALRIAAQIAEALGEAHGFGVLHCDLKPENVIIAGDGRVRVLDFGLATFVGGLDPEAPSSAALAGDPTTSESEPGPLAGTPEYMAPEQWRGGPLAGGTDVWALGAILYELCTGRLLFEGTGTLALGAAVLGFAPESLEASQDAPDVVWQLIRDCLRPDLGQRPLARDVARRIGEILHPTARSDGESCPYRGLLPFDQRDADLFFGREAAVNALAERLRRDTVLPVVGPSGAGKSSLVQAGLIPRLREHQRWLVLRLRPTTRPFRALAARLIRAESRRSSRHSSGSRDAPDERRSTAVAELAAEIEASPRRLGMELEALAERQASNVLLFVDQLEEIYTHGHGEGLSERFVEAVTSAAGDPDAPVRVVFTLRGDFLDRLGAVPEAREALAHVTVVHRPGVRELRDILVKPLELAGYRFDDPDLPDEMIAAAGGEAACLPLLQFSAQKLWEERDVERRLILRAAYDRMDGVEGALAGHADGVLSGMSAGERRVARQLLLRLVNQDQTRRVVAKEQVLTDLGEEGERVLSRLADARLLTVTSTESRQSEVELAHESLIHLWGQLARWIEETKEERGFLADVGQAAELWHKRGRRAAELWQDEALGEALRTATRLDVSLPDLPRQFIESATRRQTRRRRQKRLAIATAVVASLALSVVFALQSDAERRAREHAEEQRRIAEEKRVESLRESARAAFGQGSLLEARAKLREALELRDDLGARTLWWQLRRHPLLWPQDIGTGTYGVVFVSNGSRIAASGQDGAAHLFDAVTARREVRRGGPGHMVTITSSGDLLAGGYTGGSAVVWDAREASPLFTIDGFDGTVKAVAFDAEGKRLAAASFDGKVRMVALPTGDTLWEEAQAGLEIQGAVFAAGETLVLVDALGVMSCRDARTGALQRSVETGLTPTRSLAVSRDRTRVAIGGTERIQIRSLPTLAIEQTLTGHAGLVYGVAFHPDGRTLASSAFDRSIVLWDLRSGRVVTRIDDAHHAEVHQVAFDDDGQRLVSASWDGSLRLWSVPDLEGRRNPWSHGGGVYRVAFSPHGDRVASVGVDKTLRLWHAERGTIERTIALGARASGVAFSRDGERLASGSGSLAQVWDARTGAELARLVGHDGELWDVEFHPKEDVLLTAGEDGKARLWELGANQPLRILEGHRSDIYRATFSADGDRIATASRDRTVRLWETATGRSLQVIRDFGDRVYSVRFAGDAVVAAGFDADLRLIAGGEVSLLGQLPGRAWDLDVVGSLIGVATVERQVVIHDRASGRRAAFDGHESEVNSIRIDRRGERAVSGSDDGTVRLWRLSDGRALWHASALLPAPMRLRSQRGWERLDPEAATATDAALPPNLARVVEQEARYAATVSGRWFCVRRRDGRVELWDADHDRVARSLESPIERLVATDTGCAAQSDAGVVLVRDGEPDSTILTKATAVGHGAGSIAVASEGEAIVIDGRGRERMRLAIAPGAVRIAPLGDSVAVGYPDGAVEIHAPGQEPRRLERVPSSAPRSFMAGPTGTLVVGYANGMVGIWSGRDGRLLAQEQLHGAVIHLLAEANVVAAASELGSYVRWDLGLFERPYCEVLAEMWREIPVAWEEGRAVVRPPPSSHSCRQAGEAN
jgi:WD40 repeat protein